jgi:hypothetical protein
MIMKLKLETRVNGSCRASENNNSWSVNLGYLISAPIFVMCCRSELHVPETLPPHLQCSANRCQFQKPDNWLSLCGPREQVGHQGRWQQSTCHSWWLRDVIWNAFGADDMTSTPVVRVGDCKGIQVRWLTSTVQIECEMFVWFGEIRSMLHSNFSSTVCILLHVSLLSLWSTHFF